MCGIVGFIDPAREISNPKQLLARLTAQLAHRGPDDEGFYHGEGVHLGHRRLSIIDLDTGRQPMVSQDGRFVVLCNGEVYNYRELRPRLEARGHIFRTHSDTEVLLHLYEERGLGALDEITGMFAVAVWDRERRELILARDRLGKKPLYYRADPRGLCFGSELRALLAHPATSRSVDPIALRKYLLFDSVPAPAAIISGVHKLEPGCYLIYRDGDLEHGRYWDLRFAEARDESDAAELEWIAGAPEHELRGELWRRLKESTRLRLVSDVPLGVFLSGGIDSSAVVALMAELMPAHRIRTFSVGFESRSFDESSFARSVAAHFGTDHSEEVLAPRTMLDLLPSILGSMSEPLADGSLVPTYLLAQFTRRHVKVALGGDGGDELFLGYPTFQADRVARLADRLPRALFTRFLRPMVHRLPVETSNISLDFRLKRFVDGLMYPPDERHFVWLGSFAPHDQRRLLHPDLLAATERHDVFEDVARHRAAVRERDTFDRLSYLYAKLYMQDDILVKVDRASMAHGLEVRAPFLDHRVVDFITGLPTRHKLRGMTMKYLLKRTLAGKVPAHVISRPKKGFGMPVAEWLKGPLMPLARDLLAPDRIARRGLFDPREVGRLLDDHLAGRRDNRKGLWSLLAFELWADRYM